MRYHFIFKSKQQLINSTRHYAHRSNRGASGRQTTGAGGPSRPPVPQNGSQPYNPTGLAHWRLAWREHSRRISLVMKTKSHFNLNYLICWQTGGGSGKWGTGTRDQGPGTWEPANRTSRCVKRRTPVVKIQRIRHPTTWGLAANSGHSFMFL